MAGGRRPIKDQLPLFEGQGRGARRSRRPRQQPTPGLAERLKQLELFPEEPPPPIVQLDLFNLPQPAEVPRQRRLKSRLVRLPSRQTYLDLACELGLLRLARILGRPATYFLVDAEPLRAGLGVSTLLDARYRIEASLEQAFEDFADLSSSADRQAGLALWGGRRQGVPGSSSRWGEALVVALASELEAVPDPFLMRLRGLPGYLGHESGPSALEEGEELLAVYDHQKLFSLLPREAQPMDLEELLAG